MNDGTNFLTDHSGYSVDGGSLTCACGLKYHVSLFRPVLEAIARDAYQRAAMSPDEHIAAAIETGYAEGRVIENVTTYGYHRGKATKPE